MEKNKAIELLKQSLSKIDQFKKLSWDNQEYKLWIDNVLAILEFTFGRQSQEYIKFEYSFSHGLYTPDQQRYFDDLEIRETTLKSIIQKIDLAMSDDEKPTKIANSAPTVFIAHGGKSGALDKLREYIEALGLKPLIVEMLPSKGMTVTDKVKQYQQEADCAIIFATKGGILDTKSGKQHPRLNVIDELSSLHEKFPDRVILLLEQGAELPSNKAGLTYEHFARQSMDKAFIYVARELIAMNIIKPVNPKGFT